MTEETLPPATANRSAGRAAALPGRNLALALATLGFAVNSAFPKHKVNLGVKYFKEFHNRSTFQGYSVQFSGSIGF